ncbi:hypothetical protein HYT59_01720 [Candidatus Woesebacteria bacterium]|nr:hypothetical protein [Candidatus Woesebacteria bacterium]
MLELYRRIRSRKQLEDASLPQETYFQLVSEYIASCEGDLYVVGIDEDFWKNSFVQEAVLKVLESGRNLHAVISSDYDSYKPQWLIEHPLADITWSLGKFHQGFLIMGKSGVLVWDNNHTTYHPIEKHKGVPYRGFVDASVKKTPNYLKIFDEVKSTAEMYDLPPSSGDPEILKMFRLLIDDF